MTRRKANQNGTAGIKYNRDGTIDRRTKVGRTQPGGRDNPSGNPVDGPSPGNIRDSGHAPVSRDGTGRFASVGNSGGSSDATDQPRTDSGTSGPGTDSGKRTGFLGRFRDRAGIADDGNGPTVNYSDPETGDMGGAQPDPVNPDGKAKGGTRGPFTAQSAERLVVNAFGLIATVRNRQHWAITRPNIEVRPWAADLAELLNGIPLPYVQAASTLGAGFAVAVGMAMLAIPRIQTDAQLNAYLASYPAEMRGDILSRMQRGQDVPAPVETQPQPQQAPMDMPTAQPEKPAKHSGGAQPTPAPAHLNGLIGGDGFAA